MSVFKRLLYHNSFPSHPNSGLLDLKQTKAKQACALSSDLTSMLYICTFAPFKKKKKFIQPIGYRIGGSFTLYRWDSIRSPTFNHKRLY